MKPLKIAQVTDIHIGPNDVLYNDINVRKNFLDVIKTIAVRKDIDLIVISGDLAIDFGEIESYYWIKEVLREIPIPYLVMAGNHDSVERMSRVFPITELLKNDMLYYHKNINGLDLVFLDSEPDIVSEKQLAWLKSKDKEFNGEYLLFIHHPPALMGCEFMDRKYPLRNIAEVQKTLSQLEKVKAIFTGHYHNDFKNEIYNIPVFTTPATQMQISKQSHDFEIESLSPGWRLIEWDGNNLKTNCEYVA